MSKRGKRAQAQAVAGGPNVHAKSEVGTGSPHRAVRRAGMRASRCNRWASEVGRQASEQAQQAGKQTSEQAQQAGRQANE
jgi:hypothetical protein